MGASGSNELNALLKAKVVKIRAELDVNGSLPRLKEQVDEISKKLENKPVKLKVNFDMNVKDFNTQISGLYKKLNESKTAKTAMKLQVEIDVNGSATKIKSQLQEIYKTVGDFNKKYGQQMKQMQDMMNMPKGSGSGKIIAPVLDDRALAESVDKAKNYMKDLFGNGLFSSQELKNAQGELMGFVGTLTKANGVIEKIKYEWDKDKGSFVPINAQTLTQTEAMAHKVEQILQGLFADINKLKNGTAGKADILQGYSEMLGNAEKRTMDNVQALQAMIKNQQTFDQITKQQNKDYIAQEELIRKIIKARNDYWNASSKTGQDVSVRQSYNSLVSQIQTNPDVNLKEVELEYKKINDQQSAEVKKQAEIIANDRKRVSILQQIAVIENKTVTTDNTSQSLIREIKLLTEKARTAQDYYEIEKKVNQLKISNQNDANLQKTLDLQQKVKVVLQQLADRGTLTQEQFDKAMDTMVVNAGRSIADLERQLSTLNRRLQDENNEIKRMSQQTELKLTGGSTQANYLMHVVNGSDIEELKRYIGQIYNGNVQTMTMRNTVNNLGQAVTEMKIKMEGAGKEVETYTVQMNRADGALHTVTSGLEYNANRNLGMFEQLRIAMQRVPVWTMAMTAWYGSIRFVKEMTDQILQLDDSLTQLKRVANSNLNIDILFQGAVDLSKQLGNNVMDVLGSVNELARTFGDFNERQLLAITKTATLMSNVSDLTAEQATQDLVGTMNAFNITAEDSIHIVDSLNQVDNDYAVSTQQLADGLSKSASTAKTFGVSMEETIGYITAIGSVTMESGAVIGNSLKSIFSRITTVKSAYQDLQSVGVQVFDATTGAVRPVDKILADLAVRWNDLSDAQRQSMAVNVAGRYQLSRFLALMNNWQTATDATNTAINSQGSAMRENEKYLNSFGARINQLKSGFTELANAVGNSILSAGMMAVIQGLTGLAQAGVHVAQTFGALPAVLIPIVLILGKMGILNSVFISFTKLALIPSKLGAVKIFFNDLSTATTKFKTAYTETMAVTGGTATKTQAMASAWRAVTVAEDGATAGVKRFAIATKEFLASTLVGGIIIALGFVFEKLMNMYEQHKQKLEELQKLNDKMVTNYRTHADGMASLIQRYDELNSKTSLTTAEQTEYLNIQKQLATEIPTTVAYIDANGKAHMKNTIEIKQEIDAVKNLSKANAELTQAKFIDDMNKQADAYQKIIDNVDNLNAKQQHLIENNGKNAWTNGTIGVDQYKEGSISVIDNSKAIAQNKVEIMMAEADKTKAIQETIKSINDQATAYEDAGGKLSELGDNQISTMEKFVSQNESMLRFAKNADQYKQAYQDLFNISTKVGDVWSEAFTKMSQGMGNDQSKLSDLKNSLGDVAKAIPDTFFQMTDAMGRPTKSIDQVTEGLKGIINVSNRVAQGDGNWNGLVSSLQKAGLSADQAKVMLNNLAREHDNAKLRAEAQAQGVDGLTSSMDDLNQATLKALDLTQELFGYSSDDLGAIKTRIQAMHLMIDTEGQGAKQTDAYKQAQQELGDMLGMSASELDNNSSKIYDTVDALGKLDLTQYSMKDSWSEFVNSNKDLTQSQKDLLIQWAKTKGAKDIITGANTDIIKSNADVQQSVQTTGKNIKDVFSDKELKQKNEIKNTILDTKKTAQDDSWIVSFGKKVSNFLFPKIKDPTNGGFGDWLHRFIPPTLESDLDKAGKAISKYVKTYPEQLDALFNHLPSKTRDSLNAWGQDLQDKTVTALKKWGKSISGYKLPKVDFSKNWSSFTKWLDDLPDKTRPKLEKWYTSIKSWLAGLPKRIAHEMGLWYIAIYDWFDNLPSKVKKHTKKASDSLTSWTDPKTIKQKLNDWWNTASSWMSSLPSKITTSLKKVGKAIVKWFADQNDENMRQYKAWGKDIEKYVGGITGNWKKGLDKWGKAISDWFNGIPEKVDKSGKNMNKGIDNFFKDTLPSWGKGLEKWGKSIQKWFTDLPDNFNKWLNKVNKPITNYFKNNAPLWDKGLSNWTKSIKKWFDDAPDRFNKWLDNLNKPVTSWFKNSAPSWDKGLSNWTKSIKKWFDDLPDNFNKWLDNLNKPMTDWFRNSAPDWDKGLSDWGKGLKKSLKKWFDNLGKSPEPVKGGTDIFKQIEKGMDLEKPNLADKITDFLIKLPFYILAGAVIILMSIGRELIRGIIKGVEKLDEWQKAWDKVTKKAQDKLDDFGKEAYKKGGEILNSLKQGIEDKIGEWEKKWDDIKKTASNKLTEMKKELHDLASQLPQSISDGMSSTVGSLDSGIKSVTNKIAGGIEGGLNWVIDNIDSVLNYMDVPSSKQIKHVKIPRYATGTDSQGHIGGQALVGEEGRELAYIPKVGYTVLGENGAEILDLPKGTSVLPNKQTEIMLKDYGFPAYATGTGWLKDTWGNIKSGASNAWGAVTGFTSKIGDAFAKYFNDPKKLWEYVTSLIPQPSVGGNGVLTDTAEAGITKVKNDAVDFLSSKIKDFMSVASSAGGSGAVTSWLTTAMKLTGVPSSWLAPLASLVQHESGGNPKAINLWDSNAKAGHPSKGLFQTIDSTFSSYAMKGLGDIYNPIANAVAGIRYILARYGSIFNTPGIKSMGNGGAYRGYATGGIVDTPELAWHGEDGAEAIIPLTEKYRNRGLALWQVASEKLGIPKPVLDWLQKYLSKGGSGVASSGSGMAGASSGDGGVSGGGADSGTSGTIVAPTPRFISSLSSDGDFMVATSDTFDPPPTNYDNGDAGIQSRLSVLQTQQQMLNQTSKEYRDSLKQIVDLENQRTAYLKEEQQYLQNHEVLLANEMGKYPSLAQMTDDQKTAYQALQQDMDDSISKMNSINEDLASMAVEIKQKSTEIFTNFIDEITGEYDQAIADLQKKVDNTDFQINVLQAVSPTDQKDILNTQEQKASTLQEQQATAYNKMVELQKQHDNAVNWYGINSDEEKKVKDALDQATKDYQQYTQDVISAETDIKNTRGTIADDGIQKLKDYYSNMKSMAQDAINKEKDELQKEHDAKMKMYDDEETAINNIYDAQSKVIDQQQSDAQYASDVADKTKAIADLQNKIALLSRNGDVSSKAKVADLQDQLASAQKDLASTQQQHAIDQQKQALDNQKQAQLDAIDQQKTNTDSLLQTQSDALDAESQAIGQKYDDLINNEQHWADVRNQAISGSFDELNKEITDMATNVSQMQAGIFDGLTSDFSNYADTVKQQVAQVNAITVGNMVYEQSPTVDSLNQASSADNYTMTNGAVDATKGAKFDTQLVAPPPPPPPPPAPVVQPPPQPAPTPRTHTVVKGDTLWDLAQEFYGNPYKWTTIYEANEKPDPRKLQIGRQLIIPFDTGGFTGDWSDNGGRIALLHKKELVLNQGQTSDILNTAKIMDRLKNVIPQIAKATVSDKLATAGSITNNFNYGDINITVQGGDKKKATDIAKEVLTGLRKMGK